MSPTARSLKLLRSHGYTAEVVEHFNHYTKQRKDLFGFVDIVAINGSGFLAIQATSASNQSSRMKKIAVEPKAAEWLLAGGRIFVHGWRKKKVKRGGKAFRYECNEIEVTQVNS